MPKWIPKKVWEGQEVFVVGGAESLKKFNWDLLKPLRTIGCNDAYLHGTDICIFGDKRWFDLHQKRLAEYNGIVFTNCPQVQKSKIPWLWCIGREMKGLHNGALGWNGNTGASAINLALILGAAKIYLLGFDMKLSVNGESNWHKNNLNKPNAGVYSGFLKKFKCVAENLRKKYSEVQVINVTDDSDLNEFPKIGVEEFWGKRRC